MVSPRRHFLTPVAVAVAVVVAVVVARNDILCFRTSTGFAIMVSLQLMLFRQAVTAEVNRLIIDCGATSQVIDAMASAWNCRHRLIALDAGSSPEYRSPHAFCCRTLILSRMLSSKVMASR